MSDKTKKILYISLFSLDIVLTLFLFIVSIIMIATMPKSSVEINTKTFIGYLQGHPTVFLLSVVVPLFILLAINIIILVKFVKKQSEKKKVGLSDLSEEEKEALRKELLKDINHNE